MAYPLATERVWIEKAKYHDAEKDYFEHLSKLLKGSNNNNNNKIELQKQQDHEEEQKDQIMQSTKSKKVKKDKNKKIKLQQSSTEELSSSQNNEISSKNENENSVSVVSAAVKEQQLCIENSSSSNNITAASAAAAATVATNMNSNNINTTDDDSKQKKKKKKKNKSTEHKLNENLNNDGKSQLNDNGTGTAVSSNSNIVNNTESLNQDEITDPNNKKNEIKQRPTNLKNSKGSSVGTNQNTLVSEIAKARQHIKNSLEKMDGIAALAASPGTSPGSDVLERFTTLEKENATFKGLIEQLRKSQIECEKRINSLETKLESLTLSVQQQLQSKKPIDCVATTSKSSTTKKVDDDDDDGVDLFESDSEEESAEAAKVREQRLAEYAAKKSKKPTLIAKSNVILDVKPWDDETDLGQMEKEIRKITTDGLLWGSSKLVPVAFGIKKLTISCVVEDEKVSIDWLTEEIEKLEDYVQSVDVAAFNKI